ncbi:MAG: UDP-3-O-(3-hydroxymyristoyl)glucosamine N-acyltransferase [Lentisphaerae bacterium]|nr:UDP-3-O-(3-hydroxymyristoyl)glucosamine N-acyltransferase [Lentisphaerota bacterium]
MTHAEHQFTVSDLLPFIRDPYTLEGARDKTFSRITSLSEAAPDALTWCSPKHADAAERIRRCRAAVIICHASLPQGHAGTATLIKTADPRKTFMETVNGLLKREHPSGVHPTAVIHPRADVHAEAYIGPFCYVGRSTIGAGSVLHGHTFIYDGVRIGRHVVIEAGCVIGAAGFGYQKNHDGDWQRFPHLGGVVIEDDVEISANATIDRGALGNTSIGRNTKISKAAHISHNVVTGERCIIAGGAMISGSARLGNGVWIGPNAAVLNKITIGDGVTVGIGGVVTRNVETGFTVIGHRVLPESTLPGKA